MKTLSIVKKIYIEGFTNLGNFIVERYFRIFAWFSFVMFALVVYAFVFRVVTGFAFD